MVDMNHRNDIESLLQTGYFTTSRSKTPKPYEPRENTARIGPPLTQQRRPSPPPHATVILREPPRNNAPSVPRYVPRPPAPTVEDEAEALSKEHGSLDTASVDAPPSRGDVDQQVLLEEVHEHNPERRFVIVPNSSDSSTSAPTAPLKKGSADKEAPVEPKASTGGDYEANTARKYGPSSGDGKLAEPRVPLERRKSRQDLPRIETELEMKEPQTRNHHRSKSTNHALEPPEYFTPQTRKRVSTTKEELLSPQVIKHSTGGRDKVYYDYSKSQGRPLAPQRSRSNLVERRSEETSGRPTQSMSPGATRRSTMNADAPRPVMKESDDRPSEPSRRRDEYREDSSSRYERRREQRNSTYRRDSPPRKQRDGSSSSSDYAAKAPSSNTRRRRSTVIHDDRPYLSTPTQERTKPLSGRSRSRAPTSPIPSPQISGKSFEESLQPQGPRSSATFPTPRSSRESTLPYPEDDILPRKDIMGPREEERRVPRSRSRVPPTLTPSASVPAVMPFMPPEPFHSVDLTRPPRPVTPEARASTLQFDLRQDQAWPPAPFDPSRNSLTVDRPVGAYRRYSEDTGRDGPVQIPDCPRTKGVAGKTDWLCLSHCDNFNICPDCYSGVFGKSAFRSEFLPNLFRSIDKPISCDFGTSPWYRIAWLLTLKNNQPDLRLFHQIAKIAQSQPCPGDRVVLRSWYSIQNPSRDGTLPDFNVCYECAKTIEVLLPSLTGCFIQTQATAMPSNNICAMRYHPDRKRFVLYFDAMETTCDQAIAATSAPNIPSLAKTIDRISMFTECREDRPVAGENWYVMQYLPELTVCGDCYDDVVKPRILQDGQVARNFSMRPKQLNIATCQLYSERMREVFRKACRRNDVKYLEGKVLERQKIEASIHAELARLHKRRGQDEWTEKEMEKLISTWKKWE
ncbi:hypothetical protein BN1708_006570 [Verticillium longisporum]|uniref:Uncharacterized protein n=1 Tax=Verticillium longisporum TaxID=100787 RepID=A0A0G4MLK2_VERLO|nr:hypothetical protein BN1708_006570 [Verticillium longisporum]